MIGAKVAAGSFAPSFCSFKIAPACVFVVINSTAKIAAAAESVGFTARGIGVAASALSPVAGRTAAIGGRRDHPAEPLRRIGLRVGRGARRSRERPVGEPQTRRGDQDGEQHAGDGRRAPLPPWRRIRPVPGRSRLAIAGIVNTVSLIRGSRTLAITRENGIVGGAASADEDGAVGRGHEIFDVRRAFGNREHEQRAGFAKSATEPMPPAVWQNFFVVRRLGSALHREQLARSRNGVRDAAQRNAIQKTVDDPMRVVGLDQLANRWRLGEEISDRDAPMQRLHSRDADGDAPRHHRIGARDDDHVIRPERVAELFAGGFPIEGASRSRGRGHGVPA